MTKLTDLLEDIHIPVKIGDTILTGKWKNKKTVVKDIGEDEHGMPTINGKKVVTFRLTKKEVEEGKLNEGRYDKLVTELSRRIVNLVKSKKKSIEDDINILGNDIEFNVSITYDKKFDMAFAVQGFGDDQELEILITLNPLAFPLAFNDFIGEVKDALRHEIEHVTQHYIKGKPTPTQKISAKGNKIVNYLLKKEEIPAFIAGFHKKAKTKKITMNQAMEEFLKAYRFILSDKEFSKVEKTWLAFGKKKYPNAK